MNHPTRDISPHILSASANLLGICFLVLTSLKVLKLSGQTMVDDFARVAGCLFMVSCLFAFLSMRSKAIRNQQRLETVADYAFLLGLLVLAFTTIFIGFQFAT